MRARHLYRARRARARALRASRALRLAWRELGAARARVTAARARAIKNHGARYQSLAVAARVPRWQRTSRALAYTARAVSTQQRDALASL